MLMHYRSFSPSILALVLAAGVLLALPGCELNITNPNNPSEEQVLTTAEGVRTLTVGIQEYYATTALAEMVLTTGVSSREVAVNTTFANLVELEAGGTDLPSGNADVGAVWSANYRVVSIAEDLIEAAPTVQLSEGMRSGIVATAHLFKAAALGNLALVFEQASTTTNRVESVSFASRQQVLNEAVQLLDDALALIDQTPPSSDFNDNVLATGLDLRNTINAYRARFNLLAGNNQEAIDAANSVDPTVASTFNYNDQSPNPVWSGIIQSTNYAVRDDFGSLLTESGDQRIGYFTTDADAVSATTNEYPIDDLAVYTSSTSPFPLYVPGEMALIRAEARLNSNAPLSEVVSEIDAIRTKVAAADPLGIGADLPAYSGTVSESALRDEILRQRRAELYLQGLALADARRLGGDVSDRENPDPFERNRNFYPYPDEERRNNPNTPANPDF
jgi:hypothetical protein